MTTGILVLKGKKKSLLVKFTNLKGNQVEMSVPEKELSASLTHKKQNKIDDLEGLKVELDIDKGQPKKVREVSQSFATPPSSQSTSNKPSTRNATITNMLTPEGDFHNPYNFVPALPRSEVKNSPLGDDKPISHGKYHPNYWSGKIAVKLTTKTPLLIPDAANTRKDENNKDHKYYGVRVDAKGEPYIPPTSVKGMLRTAYEIVTNSRLSIFVKHEDRLAYRMSTKQGLNMIPARIENGKVRLYPGKSEIGENGQAQGAVYAACLPRYNLNKNTISSNAVRYSNHSDIPSHGKRVKAWLEKYRKETHQGRILFEHWRVRSVIPYNSKDLDEPNPGRSFGKYHPTNDRMILVDGYVCVTNKNIDRKHDERIFFDADDKSITCDLTDDIKRQWKDLITNYQEIHKDEICKKHNNSPPALSKSVWSRHIKHEESFTLAVNERELKEETLCYAQVKRKSDGYEVIALYPVMIARALFELPPEKLLPTKLKPAECIDDFSPADRVFGWVKQKTGQGKNTSYRGNLRVGLITCNFKDPIQNFGKDGFPLAILGQPKEQQTRFYTAKNPQGKPLEQGVPKQSGYQKQENGNQNNSGGLRGRKVYPHHRNLPEGHWDNPETDRTQKQENGHFQEYRRPDNNGQERDDQNRSITAWIKPNVSFTFNLDITNLSNVELGALLWLLSLPEDHYHRLGGGKAFGFGSVCLEIDWTKTDLRTGEQWRDFYSSLFPVDKPDSKTVTECIGKYQTAVEEAYGNGGEFAQVSFVKAFCRSAKGFKDNLPIHYPRARQENQNGVVPPHPEGKAFEWFVANERVNQEDPIKRQVSLPELINDRGLPIWQAEAEKNKK